MNRAIYTAIGGIMLAQGLKVPVYYAEHKNWDFSQAIGTGGMPSSHSCGVSALATYLALDEGFNSESFALATMLGTIVMYDAAGIRRHAGETAIQVNNLDAEVEDLAGDHPGIYHFKREKKLKETLGHQPTEVLAGALLGIAVGAFSYLTRPKKRNPDIGNSVKNIWDTITKMF